MCAACRLPLDEMLCPCCEGEIIDKRHCPSQIACGECGYTFSLAAAGVYLNSQNVVRWADPLHDDILWVRQSRMWWEDRTVFNYLEQITAPSAV